MTTPTTMITSMITTVTAMMSGVVVPSAAEQKHTTWHETRNRKTQKHSSEGNKHMALVESKMSPTPFLVYLQTIQMTTA